MSDLLVVPKEIVEKAVNEADETYRLMGGEDESNLAFAVVIARWMRDECAKVAEEPIKDPTIDVGHSIIQVCRAIAKRIRGTNL